MTENFKIVRKEDKKSASTGVIRHQGCQLMQGASTGVISPGKIRKTEQSDHFIEIPCHFLLYSVVVDVEFYFLTSVTLVAYYIRRRSIRNLS